MARERVFNSESNLVEPGYSGQEKNNNQEPLHNVGKVVDKERGEDLREGFEDGPRKQKLEDK
ncbi:44551_t:CDS:2, partial [Gigaspora margarita]